MKPIEIEEAISQRSVDNALARYAKAAKQPMKPLVIVGRINAHSGYGQIAIEYARGLERLGVPVLIRATAIDHEAPEDIKRKLVQTVQEGEWELVIHPPGFAPTPGKRTVFYTMWEVSNLPKGTLPLLNKAEAIIVPNHQCARDFITNGVTPPVHVVPMGINPDIFRFVPAPKGDPFVFGTGGSGARKGINDVVDAFLDMFAGNDHVRLSIKISPDDPEGTMKPVTDSRITVVKERWTEQQMADWLASMNVFVSASRSEGWGLIQHQAMAVGRPLIAIQHSGLAEFFDRSCGYPLDHSLEVCQEGTYKGGIWAVPNMQDLRFAMKQAVICREEQRIKGENASAVASRLTWRNACSQLADRLEEIGVIQRHSTANFVRENLTPPTANAFYHSGNLGDVIYALPAIRAYGGGELIIGPSQNRTSPCAVPIDVIQFKKFLPLLKLQPYLKSVVWREYYPMGEIGHDLNKFRDLWNDWKARCELGIHNLCHAHFETLRTTMLGPLQPWIETPDVIKTDRIVIHRSMRYNQSQTMWMQLVRQFRKDLLFIGLEDEWRNFKVNFGNVSFWGVSDFLEMARIIAGAKAFVGNQSFPMAIAIACGQKVFQEVWAPSPDCIFNRWHFKRHDKNAVKEIGEWL